MASRHREAIRGVGALLLLLVLLVAPPVALALFVGWPLPTSLPSLSGIGDAAQGGIDDMVIVKVLALVGWVAWAQVAAAIFLEGVALVRGRRARSMPAMHGIQLAVGQLLAMVALLFGTMAPVRAAAVPLSSFRPASVVQPEAVTLVDPVAARTRPAASQRPAAAEATYVVQPLDSWWGVAESELGDGRRWQELRSLNVGRAMPDGRTVEPATETIYAGWVLRIPGEGAASAGAAEAADSTPAEVTVVPGDNLWELAEADLETSLHRQASNSEIAPYWQAVIDENSNALVEAGNPSLIVPGQVITFPRPAVPTTDAPPDLTEPATPRPAPAPSQSSTSTTSSPPTTSTTVRDASTSSARVAGEPDTGETRRDTILSPGALGAAGTLLATGISAAVWRRRRRREQSLPRGARMPDPPPQLDGIRAEVVREADVEAIDLLNRALAGAARELAGRGPKARVRLVQTSRSRIELLLSEPILPAPDGWHPEASGMAWVLDDVTACPDAGDLATHPTLVSLGRCDDAEIYLDLEAEGLVAVGGDPERVGDFVRSVIKELSTDPGHGASVIVCGSPAGVPGGDVDRVRRVDDWNEVADDVLLWATQTRDLLDANHWPSAASARAIAERPDLAPTVLITAGQPEDDRFEELCSILGENLIPVVVIAAGSPLSGATAVEIVDAELRIPTLGLRCEAQSLAEPAAAAVDALLADADRVPEQLPFVETEPEGEEDEGVAAGDDYVDPPFEILVKVLGNIEVVGGRQPLGPKQTAVVSYVALHSPVAAERIEDGVWSAPTSSRRKRLANTISEARHALGSGHLPPSSDGKYRVGPGVVTDLDLFERRIAYARAQTDSAAVVTLRGALDLVAGPVFTYRNTDRASYVWVDLENWISTCELKVTETAGDLAARYVAAGDLKGAIWAARQGLAASPTHARLTAALMQAHIEMGDERAAAQVYQSHVSALERMEIDDVAPELVDTYEHLRAVARRTAKS